MEQFVNEILSELDKINLNCLGISLDSSNAEIYHKFTDNFAVEYSNVMGDSRGLRYFIGLKHSIKKANITFSIKDAATFISENALALGMSYDSLSPWKIVILIVCNLINFATKFIVKLDDDMVNVVEFLDRENAYKGIDKQAVYDHFKVSKLNVDEALQKLVEIKTIVIDGDVITLKEKVCFTKKKNKG